MPQGNADVADVESSRQQHVKDGCERGIGRRASTDQPDALTAQHLIASTRDRRLDEAETVLAAGDRIPSIFQITDVPEFG